MLNFFSSVSSIVLTIIVFLIIFAILIIWHELGHFWAARAAKIKVLEFGFGMPPKIWGKKTVRKTKNEAGENEEMEWTLNAIPFGGFVRMMGEDGTNTDHPNAFGNRPLAWRMLVIAGGVIMNFILGWAIFTYAFTVGIEPSPISKEEYEQFLEEGLLMEKEDIFIQNITNETSGLQKGDRIIMINDENDFENNNKILEEPITEIVIERFNSETKTFENKYITEINFPLFVAYSSIGIASVQKNSPAEKAELKQGDIIKKINNISVFNISTISEIIKNSTQKSLLLEIERNNKNITLEITPTDEKKIGIISKYIFSQQENTLSIGREIHIYPIKNRQYSWKEAPQQAFFYSFQIMGKSVDALGNFITQLISKQTIPEGMGGPVAIASHTNTLLEYGNIMSLILFTAMLSLSLAVLNIMPFPGLDGGRFIFLLIEAILLLLTFISTKIFRTSYQFPKRLPSSLEGIINALGFITLLILLFWITGNDILQLIL